MIGKSNQFKNEVVIFRNNNLTMERNLITKKMSSRFSSRGIISKEEIIDYTDSIDKRVEYINSIDFLSGDQVVCKSPGAFDMYLDRHTTYTVIRVSEKYIVIKDDSGNENPYLKARFTHLAKTVV